MSLHSGISGPFAFQGYVHGFRIEMAITHLEKTLICLPIACELIEFINCARDFINFVEI
jgi:hypothetical protein